MLVLKHTSQSRFLDNNMSTALPRDFVTTFARCSGFDSGELCADAWNSVSFSFLNPVTSQEDLPTDLSNPSCHSSFYLGFEFLGIAPVFWLLIRHFALILNMTMNLKQVAPLPWVLVPPLFSTSPVIAMQKTNCFLEWWIVLERQEVRNCLSCR